MPVLQTREQLRVEHTINAMADANSKRLGMTRRDYLRTSCGMAVAFLAMNSVFGKFFFVDAVEAFEPEAAALGSVPAGTFMFDDQLHHVSDLRWILPRYDTCGSPQWQIDAFWRFQIPEPLKERFDYPDLDAKTTLQILGLNAAKPTKSRSTIINRYPPQLQN